MKQHRLLALALLVAGCRPIDLNASWSALSGSTDVYAADGNTGSAGSDAPMSSDATQPADGGGTDGADGGSGGSDGGSSAQDASLSDSTTTSGCGPVLTAALDLANDTDHLTEPGPAPADTEGNACGTGTDFDRLCTTTEHYDGLDAACPASATEPTSPISTMTDPVAQPAPGPGQPGAGSFLKAYVGTKSTKNRKVSIKFGIKGDDLLPGWLDTNVLSAGITADLFEVEVTQEDYIQIEAAGDSDASVFVEAKQDLKQSVFKPDTWVKISKGTIFSKETAKLGNVEVNISAIGLKSNEKSVLKVEAGLRYGENQMGGEQKAYQVKSFCPPDKPNCEITLGALLKQSEAYFNNTTNAPRYEKEVATVASAHAVASLGKPGGAQECFAAIVDKKADGKSPIIGEVCAIKTCTYSLDSDISCVTGININCGTRRYSGKQGCFTSAFPGGFMFEQKNTYCGDCQQGLAKTKWSANIKDCTEQLGVKSTLKSLVTNSWGQPLTGQTPNSRAYKIIATKTNNVWTWGDALKANTKSDSCWWAYEIGLCSPGT